jgi:hypothetical protein
MGPLAWNAVNSLHSWGGRGAGDTNWAQFIIFAQPKERFVGLTNTQLTRRDARKVGLPPIMIAGQPPAVISAPMERTPPTHE